MDAGIVSHFLQDMVVRVIAYRLTQFGAVITSTASHLLGSNSRKTTGEPIDSVRRYSTVREMAGKVHRPGAG